MPESSEKNRGYKDMSYEKVDRLRPVEEVKLKLNMSCH